MRWIVSIVILILFILLLSGALIKSAADFPFHGVLTKDYIVTSSPYAITISSARTHRLILRVSPLDDWIYTEHEKRHVFDRVDTETSKKNDITDFIAQFTFENTISWEAYGESNKTATHVEYRVKASGKKLTVVRTVPLRYQAFGKSLRICDHCYVTDQQNRVYLNDGVLSSDLVALLERGNRMATVVSADQALPEVTEIKVLDPYGQLVFSVPVEKNETVYFDQIYNLLEFKTTSSKSQLQHITI